MSQPVILVSGANGQLGREFRRIHHSFPEFQFILADKIELDVTVESWVMDYLKKHRPAVVINCAAYTNVERAEDEIEFANQTNRYAPGFLAKACKEMESLLIHISTDYVFDGSQEKPYTETDEVHPLNVYGESKLEGERLIDEKTDRHIIIRTSWLYSTFGHNFFKTMIRLAKANGELNVVNDQKSSPTYAGNLANDILVLLKKSIIEEQNIPYGIYHYSHEGEATWFDFASEIVKQLHLDVPVNPVHSGEHPVKAIRPSYSKLDNTKWNKIMSIPDLHWKDGLKKCVEVYLDSSIQ